MEKFIIGLRNGSYRLYKVSENILQEAEGYTKYIIRYEFVKRISKDKTVAISKHPEATLDENIGSQRPGSFNTYRTEWTSVNLFRFGKYRYQRIDNTNDISYVTWYWSTLEAGDHKEYVEKILNIWGYEVESQTFKIGKRKITNNRLIDTNEIKRNEKRAELYHKLLAEKENGKSLFLNAERNPNSKGNITKDDIVYHFVNTKYGYYNGMEFYLPVINGHGKRIKNKKIEITEYNIKRDEYANLVVEIINFKVVK